jgi:chitinase
MEQNLKSIFSKVFSRFFSRRSIFLFLFALSGIQIPNTAYAEFSISSSIQGVLAQIGFATAVCPAWAEGKSYSKSQVISYNGANYTCIQPHTAWPGANWNPAGTPSLWQKGGDCGTTPSPNPIPPASPTVTPSPSPEPSVTATPTPAPTKKPKPTPTPTLAPSSTPTVKPTTTPTPPSPTPTPTVKPAPTPNPTSSTSGNRFIAYFTEWGIYGRNYHVSNIPADQITHINYAFANVSSSGECVMGDSYADIDKFYPGDSWDAGVLRGNFNQLNKLKVAYPKLKTLISVGGWTWSGNFPMAAATAASRDKFAKSCVQFAAQYGFDGVDIDWEYPVSGGLTNGTPEDKQNFTLLLQALRTELNAQGQKDGKNYLLTIAAPAGATTLANLEIAKIAAILDWINLMTYDFHGAWENQTGFNAALYAQSGDQATDPLVRTSNNVDAAVQAYLSAGVPPKKLVVGAPVYGRGWAGVPSTNNGLYQSATGPSQGTWEAGVLDWHDIKQNYLPKMIRYWDTEGQVPYLYNPSTKVFITYDDEESTNKKVDYILSKGLGGVMIWELSSDDSNNTLIRILNRVVK